MVPRSSSSYMIPASSCHALDTWLTPSPKPARYIITYMHAMHPSHSPIKPTLTCHSWVSITASHRHHRHSQINALPAPQKPKPHHHPNSSLHLPHPSSHPTSHPQLLAIHAATAPSTPKPPTTFATTHPFRLSPSLHRTNPRGSPASTNPPRTGSARLSTKPFSGDPGTAGTKAPSLTHSPSRCVSQSARSPRARALYLARSLSNPRRRSPAHLASRTCASFSSRWVWSAMRAWT